MTGLHDKRATAAAPPPARRSNHAEVPVPPRKREHSVPAARVARSPRLPDVEWESDDVAPAPPPPKHWHSVPAYGDRDPMDVAVAPPAAPRAEAPVPPPHTAYALRDRHVTDTSNRKPYIPAPKEKREELKHDRPCSSMKKPNQPEPWEAPSCAHMGLEHYNSMNQGDEHELVKAVGVHSFICCGGWLHANFLARRKDANNCVDIVPELFFAELKIDGFGLSCASCVKIDSVESKNPGGCGHCQGKITHPASGVYLGAKDRRQPAAVYLGEKEDHQPDDAADLEIAFDF